MTCGSSRFSVCKSAHRSISWMKPSVCMYIILTFSVVLTLSWPPACCVSLNLFVHLVHSWSPFWHCAQALKNSQHDPDHYNSGACPHESQSICFSVPELCVWKFYLAPSTTDLTSICINNQWHFHLKWQDTTMEKQTAEFMSALSKLFSALTLAVFVCFREIMVSIKSHSPT